MVEGERLLEEDWHGEESWLQVPMQCLQICQPEHENPDRKHV